MTVADDRVDAFACEIDQREREYATAYLEAAERTPVPVGNAERLWYAARPIMRLVLKLGVGGRPGEGVDADADWAVTAAFARREVLAYRDADWSNAVFDRVSLIADARRCGSARVLHLSKARDCEDQSTDTTAGWLLRHPADHYFSRLLGSSATRS